MHHIALCCLEGSTPEDGSGASHQAKDIVVAPGEPILYCQGQLFCFVAFLSARGQTSRMRRVRQGNSLTWMTIRIWL